MVKIISLAGRKSPKPVTIQYLPPPPGESEIWVVYNTHLAGRMGFVDLTSQYTFLTPTSIIRTLANE